MNSFITSKQIKDAVANTPQVVFEITELVILNVMSLKFTYTLIETGYH